jgi:hypothetical protein
VFAAVIYLQDKVQGHVLLRESQESIALQEESDKRNDGNSKEVIEVDGIDVQESNSNENSVEGEMNNTCSLDEDEEMSYQDNEMKQENDQVDDSDKSGSPNAKEKSGSIGEQETIDATESKKENVAGQCADGAQTSPPRSQSSSSICLMDEFDSHDVDCAGGVSSPVLVNNGYLTQVERERLSFASKVTGHSISALAFAILAEKNSGSLPYFEDGSRPVPGTCPMSAKELSARKEYKSLYDRFLNYNYLEIRRDLVCRVSTSMEVNRMMGEFQDLSSSDVGQLYKDMLPSPGALSGTCHVRVVACLLYAMYSSL